MTGTFSIDYKPVIILFDSGATHSFISNKCVARVGLDSYQAKCQTRGHRARHITYFKEV
jgi:hypothetical protein